jgi:Phage tail fibre adhesin Gp38
MVTPVHVLSFVEIDVPHCSLTYSVAPCAARTGFAVAGGAPTDGTQPNAVGFNNSYARRVAGLTSAADSLLTTGSFWFFADDNVASDQTLYCGVTTLAGATTRFRIRLLSGVFRITGINAAGTTVLDIRNTTPIVTGRAYHFLWSVNLAAPAQRHLYVNDVSDLNVVTYVNSAMDLTVADHAFGALADGNGKVDAGSWYADFWIRHGIYIDLAVVANRRNFITASGQPVYLGPTGLLPTGGAPAVYFGNPAASYHTNLGGGGGFTIQNSGGQYDTDFATGSIKCFNSLGTCQDRANYTDAPVTLRFAEDVSLIPLAADALPLIKSIDYDPTILSLNGELGQRATLKVVFRDAPHSDAGLIWDKYPTTRTYGDPYNRGTFWGKFRARNPFLRGRNIRLVRGTAEQAIAEMETRHFIIESIDGPNAKGEFSIIAKDALKFADGDRAVAPLLSEGFLQADITDVATSATLSPSGIGGNYPADGLVAIGGNEICSFTRSGDTLTLSRGIANTVAVAHSASDRVQLILGYEGEDGADILSDLLQTYADVPGAYIPLADWQNETAAFLGTVYTMAICEPTAVADLISELLLQMGAAMWWDDLNQLIRLQVLRAVATDADRWNEDNVLENTVDVREQPEKRVSQVIVYFGQINPLLKVDETRNYRSTQSETDAQSEADEGSAAIKVIFARGIAQGGRTVATRIAQKHLSRFVRAPRRFELELMRYAGQNPQLGAGIRLGGGTPAISSWPFQDATGDRVDIPIQITRVNAMAEKYLVEAEEMLFTGFGADIDPTLHTIILDSSENNINLRTRHDALYADPVSGDTVICIVSAGAIIGSSSSTTAAFTVGSFPAGVTVTIHVEGRIQGAGGHGGDGSTNGSPDNGDSGGNALLTAQAIRLSLAGEIWSGGGGGGTGTVLSGPNTFRLPGGGGAGTIPGTAGATTSNAASDGTATAGGAGAIVGGSTPGGGAGGNPGQGGQGGQFGASPGSGGAAGFSITGNSFITTGTWDGTTFTPGALGGSVLGPTTG